VGTTMPQIADPWPSGRMSSLQRAWHEVLTDQSLLSPPRPDAKGTATHLLTLQ